jgi:hypothetical protein
VGVVTVTAEPVTLSLVGYMPMLVNEAYRKPFYRRAEHDALWKQHFSALAETEGIGDLGAVMIEVLHVKGHGRTGRGKLPDIGACYPAVKAAVDGLVDAGVLADDDGRHVRSLVFYPPEWGEEDEVRLVLHPIDTEVAA